MRLCTNATLKYQHPDITLKMFITHSEFQKKTKLKGTSLPKAAHVGLHCLQNEKLKDTCKRSLPFTIYAFTIWLDFDKKC